MCGLTFSIFSDNTWPQTSELLNDIGWFTILSEQLTNTKFPLIITVIDFFVPFNLWPSENRPIDLYLDFTCKHVLVLCIYWFVIIENNIRTKDVAQQWYGATIMSPTSIMYIICRDSNACCLAWHHYRNADVHKLHSWPLHKRLRAWCLWTMSSSLWF